MAYKITNPKNKKLKRTIEYNDEFFDETTGKKVGEGKSWENKSNSYDFSSTKTMPDKEETEEYFLGKNPRKHKDYKFYKGEK